MQEFGLIKSLPGNVWLSEACFSWVLPEQSASFLISSLNSFRGCWRAAASGGHAVVLRGQLESAFFQSAGSVHRPLFDRALGHFMVAVSRGAGKAHSQLHRRVHWRATQRARLWTTAVFLASWSRKIFLLVASSHIYSYFVTIIDLIRNCISAFFFHLFLLVGG